MRRGFTLLEIVTVVAVGGILAAGSFKALQALYVRSAKARAVTSLSLSTQALLNQLGVLLYDRVPASVVGYDPADGTFAPLAAMTDSKPVLEWIGTAEEARTLGAYSGFVDMNASDPAAGTLASPGTDGDAVAAVEREKFGTQEDIYARDRVRLAFAGTFDEGGSGEEAAEAFGWHGAAAGRLWSVSIDAQGVIALQGDPAFIYEKYYLADGAYAVARGADIDRDAQCLADAGIEAGPDTLLLFYDYRPWRGESFCADPRSGDKAGKVTPLAEYVRGFRAEWVDGTIRLYVETLRPVRGASPVRISKQKVVF
ncbi:type II secretion system protein [Hydrogenimonas sp.]